MKPTLITSLALGSVLAMGATTLSAAENPFEAMTLKQGYQLAGDHGKDGEGKCGEGKCGETKKSEAACGGDKKAEGKCGEAKCGAEKGDADKKADGKCGEGKCGEDKSA
jgi:uncharacterized low-complexity protein